MTIPQLSKCLLCYGGPSMLAAGFLHILAFVYIGRMYRTKEEELSRRDRDDDLAMRGVWLLVSGTALCLASLVRQCL